MLAIEPLGFASDMFTSEIKTLESPQNQHASFEQWLVEKVHETNHTLQNADLALQDLATGKTENLHQTMLTLEQAKLSMQMMEQVRNRLFGAWQEILREQI